MGATFPDIKRNIRHAIGKQESPEGVVKVLMDALCLMAMLYGVDVKAMAEERSQKTEGK